MDSPGNPSLPELTVLCPIFSADAVGGLQLAITDVVAQLQARGWRVQQPLGPTCPAPAGREVDTGARAHTGFRSGLSRLGRVAGLFRLWHRLPLAWRRGIAVCFMPAEFFANAADTLRVVDNALEGLDPHAPVLLFVDGTVPGMTALVTQRHGNTVIVSLGGLAEELDAHWWRLARQVARLRLGAGRHAALYRQVHVQDVRCAVFASRQWQREAVRAGLPASAARTVYFGIPQHEPVNRPVRSPGTRLLWLGRLTPDKGLHLLLPCLRDIQKQVPGLSLTVYAAQGQAEYRDRIMAQVAQHELQDILSIRGPVPRAELPAIFRDHDALFFYSRYREPVALAMMEACASGLPVLCSQANEDAALVQHDRTCWCYAPDDPRSIVEGVARVLTDAPLRERLARTAAELLAGDFSLEAMGREYDALLLERLDVRDT